MLKTSHEGCIKNLQLKEIIDLDVTKHLIQIAFLDDVQKLGSLYPTNTNSLTKILEKSLCYRGVFYSKHSDLFQTSNTITNQYRQQVSQQFLITRNEMESYDVMKLQDCLDHYQGLLIFGWTMLNQCIFEDLTFLIGVCLTIGKKLREKQGLQEIQQINIDKLLIKTIELDILYSIVNGHERLCNENFKRVIGKPTKPMLPDLPYKRQFQPCIAQGTVWENTIWAVTFDELLEYSQMSMNLEPNELSFQNNVKFNQFEQFINNLNFITKESFSQPKESLFSKRIQLQKQLLLLIQQQGIFSTIEISPTLFLYSFPDHDLKRNNPLITKFDDCLQFMFLFAILHVTATQSDHQHLFPLVYGGPSIYSPRDILYSLTRMVTFIVRNQTIPMLPQESFFGPIDYSNQNLTNVVLPSPLLITKHIIFIYGISVCSLMAFQMSPIDIAQSKEVFQMIDEFIVPFLTLQGELSPLASTYALKLSSLLGQL
ncbi:hypothetical protein HDV02_000394 [Globomyces sp. JEL0801]|nr:hypothetical protein HDV02_000394 [Globomyces sp. JEL0801]